MPKRGHRPFPTHERRQKATGVNAHALDGARRETLSFPYGIPQAHDDGKLDSSWLGTLPLHHATHENGGADEISVIGLSGLLADPQTPLGHHASHESGGGDAIKIDDLAAGDDNTDLNVSTAKHGLTPKLPNDATKFLDGTGAYTVPTGSTNIWTYVPKTTDETRTSNAALADDSTLKFTMAISTRYAFKLEVFYDTGATPDFKFRHTGPGGATFVQIFREIFPPGGAMSDRNEEAYSAADVSMLNVSGTQGYIRMSGVISNGLTGGDFKFQWAQNTSDTAATTVRGGSLLKYRVV